MGVEEAEEEEEKRVEEGHHGVGAVSLGRQLRWDVVQASLRAPDPDRLPSWRLISEWDKDSAGFGSAVA